MTIALLLTLGGIAGMAVTVALILLAGLANQLADDMNESPGKALSDLHWLSVHERKRIKNRELASELGKEWKW